MSLWLTAPITIGVIKVPKDWIKFDFWSSDIIWAMNWLHAHWAKIDREDLRVILRDEKGRDLHFYGKREEKSCALISAVKASMLFYQGYIGR